jgi:hypothetical protein
MHISAYMLSCDQRAAVRERTLANFLSTDWGAEPKIELDRGSGHLPAHIRMAMAVRKLLRRVTSSSPQFILFLEDDLRFNRHLRHNLDRWLQGFDAVPDCHFFATLFNPSSFSIGARVSQTSFVVDEKCAFGSQALLFSSATARHFLDHWDRHDGLHDFRMYHLAAIVGPIYCHAPSLVQHVNVPSTWGGPYVRAHDFFADWRASSSEGGHPAVD